MLGVGVDWAEAFHDVAIGRPGEGVIEQFRIEHGPAGVGRLAGRCLELEADPAEVRVVLETRHGPLVEALADAGFTVLPVNPDLVARRRGPAKKKDDAEDARICCLLALDTYLELRKLIPHGETGTELRAIARDDERAARDERRIGNRLRADLLAVFPAAIDHRRRGPGRPGVPGTAGTLALGRGPRRGLPPRRSRTSPGRVGMAGPPGSPSQVMQGHGRAPAAGTPRAGPRQGRDHPAGRRPAAAPALPAAGMGKADGRAADRRAPDRPGQDTEGP